MERISLSDGAVVAELQKWLQLQLYGNAKDQGLYYRIAHNISNWDQYQQMAGHIAAFEIVLAQIAHIANSQGTGLEETVVFSRSGLN